MKIFFLKIIAIIFTAYLVLSFPPIKRQILYPFPYRKAVEDYSGRYNVDKFLSIAVMKTESNFSETAKSQSGAVGLMQLMPETAAWIAYRLGDYLQETDEGMNFYAPDTNIRYGIWYLSELQAEFEGNDVLALAAYNAGRGNVRHWIEKNYLQKDSTDIEGIPYAETRDYVKKVLYRREKYRELYENEKFPAHFVEPGEITLSNISPRFLLRF